MGHYRSIRPEVLVALVRPVRETKGHAATSSCQWHQANLSGCDSHPSRRVTWKDVPSHPSRRGAYGASLRLGHRPERDLRARAPTVMRRRRITSSSRLPTRCVADAGHGEEGLEHRGGVGTGRSGGDAGALARPVADTRARRDPVAPSLVRQVGRHVGPISGTAGHSQDRSRENRASHLPSGAHKPHCYNGGNNDRSQHR